MRVSGFSTRGVNEVYDPATDTWETKAAMPTPRLNLRGEVVENKIHLIGGVSHEEQSGVVSSINEVYAPVADKWSDAAPIPTAFCARLSITLPLLLITKYM